MKRRTSFAQQRQQPDFFETALTWPSPTRPMISMLRHRKRPSYKAKNPRKESTLAFRSGRLM